MGDSKDVVKQLGKTASLVLVMVLEVGQLGMGPVDL